MNIPLNGSTVAIGILVITNLATLYSRIRSPQIKGDKDSALLREEVATVKRDMGTMQLGFEKQILEIKTQHIAGIEKDMKELTATIATLSNELTKLATILDERIPRKS